MAKSKRSKVKMAYKAMRRAIMQPKLDAELCEQAGRVYKAIGLPMPDSNSDEFRTRRHGGSEIVTTFVPTPKGPALNAVHGPLANKRATSVERPSVGFPIAGSAKRARALASGSGRKDKEMDADRLHDGSSAPGVPYFYPRRDWKRRAIHKQRREGKLKEAKRKKDFLNAVRMEVENVV